MQSTDTPTSTVEEPAANGKPGVTVGDIMVRNVRTVSQNTRLAEAMSLMQELGFRHLIVECGGHLVGVCSERDILKHIIRCLNQGERPDNVLVSDLMVTEPITVGPDTPLGEAAGIMATKKLGCLSVLSCGRHVVGIVTVVDLLHYMTDQIHKVLNTLAMEINEGKDASPKDQAALSIIDAVKTLMNEQN